MTCNSNEFDKDLKNSFIISSLCKPIPINIKTEHRPHGWKRAHIPLEIVWYSGYKVSNRLLGSPVVLVAGVLSIDFRIVIRKIKAIKDLTSLSKACKDSKEYIIQGKNDKLTCIVDYNDSEHEENCGYFMKVFNSLGELIEDTFPGFELQDDSQILL